MPLLPTGPPNTSLPPGATDCHMHIYGDIARYPVNAASPFKPVAGGTIDNYLMLMGVLGLQRAVVVQPSAYGTDNRCTLDAMARIGKNARGVAVVDEQVTDAEIERLTKLGIRGLRYFMLSGGVLSWESLPRLAARVAEHGWHIQMQMDGRFLHEKEDVLAGLPGRLVIDHNGKFLEPVALEHPGVEAMRRLLDSGRTYVKTSGVYETSEEGPPHLRAMWRVSGVCSSAPIPIAASGRRTGRTLPSPTTFAGRFPPRRSVHRMVRQRRRA